MEARHLRYAIALAEHQHFGRAANAVGIAQPPLSKQIAALEREVGARLFDRTARGVFPTAAGEAFLARARRSLAEMAGAAADAGRAERGEIGELRIGFIGSALLELLPAVLNAFVADHPDVRLGLHEMSTSASTSALIAGELDVSIGRGAPRGAGAERLTSVTVGRDDLVAVVGAAHPFAGQRSVGIEQLRDAQLIVAPWDAEPATMSRLRPLLEPGTDAAGRVIEARDVHTIIGLAACGVGVGMGPSCMRAVARAGVWFCAVTPRIPLPELVLSYRKTGTSPVLREFLDTVRSLGPAGANSRFA
ncbi:LysR family transcriptional regulator [Nocardia sp. NPDC006044]|uniref:LysR family transcriptional regulator n=1 Tax=Nocardia sp. NPDC006044 TaxID=3364306 RepID=UPI0036B91C7C